MSRGQEKPRGALVAGLRTGLAAGAIMFAAGLGPQAKAAEIYGLVVGINDYIGTQNDLDGAVNDARDIAGALDKAGAKTIITSSSDAKLERARQLGAAECINYKTTPDWEKRVLELTDGVGVDHVVEVGGVGTLEKSLQAVRIGGTVSLIGVLTGAGTMDPMAILRKSIRMQGIYVGSRAMFEAMNRAMSLHSLRPVVDRAFPFEESREALSYMESAAHFGKIVVTL